MNRYFSIDCEFSGLDHTKYDLISIGIVEVVKDGEEFKIDHTRKFYIELKPQHRNFDPNSMKINGLDFDNLYRFGSEPIEACKEINKFLDLKNEDTAIFIGYCGVLDKIYMDQLYLLAKIENPFNYEIIEISSLAIGKIGFEFGFTEEELENKLNIKKLNTKMKHNALHDAEHQAEEFMKIMNYKND